VLGPVRLAIGKRGLSTRGIDRVLKVAWTLADLAGHDQPGPTEVMEALSLRSGEWQPQQIALPA
jgi:magnesium chelatase family protein